MIYFYIKTKFGQNTTKPTQKIYEEAKAAYYADSDTTLSDYAEVKS